jgi:hypothetical protein
VVWEERVTASNGDIRGQVVDRNGMRVGAPIAIATGAANASQPAVAGGANGQFFVAWRDNRNAARTGTDVFGRRVNGRTVLDGAGLRLSTDTQSAKRTEAEPDVAWNGSSYLTVWSAVARENGDLMGDQRRPNGTRVAAGPLFGGINTTLNSPAITTNGSTFFVVVVSGSGTVASLIVPNGNFANRRFDFIASPNAEVSEPAVAFDGRFLVVWVQESGGETELWGTQVTPNGTVVDPEGLVYATNLPVNLSPALAGQRGSTP